MRSRGFTLIELLLASVLAAVLLGGVLLMASAAARDARRIRAASSDTSTRDALVELIRWDLANASTVLAAPDGSSITITGHGGIDRNTLAATNRLTIGVR